MGSTSGITLIVIVFYLVLFLYNRWQDKCFEELEDK